MVRSPYSHERKTDLLNCLDDMVDMDDVQCDSTDWIECVNREGLTFVNDLTFEIFVAMELEISISARFSACKPIISSNSSTQEQ